MDIISVSSSGSLYLQKREPPEGFYSIEAPVARL